MALWALLTFLVGVAFEGIQIDLLAVRNLTRFVQKHGQVKNPPDSDQFYSQTGPIAKTSKITSLIYLIIIGW
jgi:hypothetical protein